MQAYEILMKQVLIERWVTPNLFDYLEINLDQEGDSESEKEANKRLKAKRLI